MKHVAWFPVVCLVVGLLASSARAAEERLEMNLWPAEAPGETGDIGEEGPLPARAGEKKKVIRLANVSTPVMTLYQPPADIANGCCVIVAPGGGYSILAYDLEGTEICEWLNSIGVTAVLLKYRVPRRADRPVHEAPLQDAQRAIRLVRASADDWGIDSSRIGFLGFSAGGHLAVMTATAWGDDSYEKIDAADDLSCRPDFLIAVYPAYLGDKQDPNRLNREIEIAKDTPPMFIAITYDDADRAIYAALLLVELKRNGVPAELHIYSKGGHGYGKRPSSLPVSKWHKRCEEWMRASGLLAKAK